MKSPPGGRQTDIAWSDAGRVIASGFAMGTADVVPGVSGGTMAVACGIYGQLLGAIASINKQSLATLVRFRITEFLSLVHFRFLASLVLGLASAVVVMVKLVGLPGLILTRPTLVYGLFFGLVFASIFVLGKKVAWGPIPILSAIFGTGFGFMVVSMVPVDMPGSPLFMFMYGVIAISAMLLPGISGSFILLILGQYERVITSLESLLHGDLSALAVIIPFSLGCLTGLAAFSRVVAWLLRRYFDPVMAGLSGLLLGSLWRIWPYQDLVTQEIRGKMRVIEATPVIPDHWELLPWLLLAIGFATVFLVEFLAKLRTPSEVPTS